MKLGTNDINSVYLGTNEISKVYLGTNLVWENAFDVDYQAILDYATTQGYTLPSAGQQSKQNKLVIDLKAAGIWSKLDTFAVFATDGNSDFALIDWIRLIQYTAVNSPTFTTNQGFTGNATSSYILTNYTETVDSVNYTSSNASYGVFWAKNTTTGYLSGNRNGSNVNESFLQASGSLANINSNNAGNRQSFTSQYNFMQVHISSGNQYLYGDGNSDKTTTVAGTPGLSSVSKHLLVASTPALQVYSNAQIRSFYAGASLVSESSDFNTALTNYYNAL
jgi:hypothetical protein